MKMEFAELLDRPASLLKVAVIAMAVSVALYPRDAAAGGGGGLDPFRPQAGVSSFETPGTWPVPNGVINLANGNLTIVTPSLSVPSLFGHWRAHAVYNSSGHAWRFSWDLYYDGRLFIDDTGLHLSALDNLEDGSRIAGTEWIKHDATHIRTIGGLVYEFDPTSHGLSRIYWLSSDAQSRLSAQAALSTDWQWEKVFCDEQAGFFGSLYGYPLVNCPTLPPACTTVPNQNDPCVPAAAACSGVTPSGLEFVFSCTHPDYAYQGELSPSLEFYSAPNGNLQIAQCDGADCVPLFDVKRSGGQVTRVTSWIDPRHYRDQFEDLTTEEFGTLIGSSGSTIDPFPA